MTSEQGPDRAPVRRRMAGATAGPPRMEGSPATKTRMGGAAGHVTMAPESQVSSETSTTGEAPVRVAKKRMGGAPVTTGTDPAIPPTPVHSTATKPTARTRMGAAPATPATRTGVGVEVPAAPDRQRMAGAPSSGTTGAASTKSVDAATPAAASTASAPSGRAGTPGPAGAATPVKPERPWVRPVLITAALVVVAVAVVLGARWLRTLEGVQEFIATYDGHASQPESAPEGIPWWLGWQHFFNMFLIVLIIRTGLQVRTERKPPGYWTAKKDSFFSPAGNTPKKVSLSQWLHQSLDVLWVINGVVFIVLLFATGHWARIVPTSWDIVPNMVSAGLQYASLDWPTENGWVHYNALQVVAYFTTVFIAAPLAVLSGIRFSTWWPERAEKLTKAYPVQWARAVHFPVMLYFVAFTIVHVFLVFFTGALRNLNHMYTSRDVVDWWGLVIFLASLVVIAAAWFLTKPVFTTPLATQMGNVTKN
jgi:thiosulfate reductase cytochrome b subunit